MNHPAKLAKPLADMTDEERGAWLASLPPSSIPTPADHARAKACYAAGAGVAHVVVGAWLKTWGQAGRKDFPDWLRDQDG